MAEEIFDTCRYGNYIGMSLRITDSNPRHQPQNSSPTFVTQMLLNFKVQLKCQHFQVCEEDTRRTPPTLISEYISSQHPFATYQLPISIFKFGGKTLKRFLFREFQIYRDIINIELVVDEIIKHWVKIVEEEDQENNCRMFNKIYPLEIAIEFLVFHMIYGIDQLQVMMDNQPQGMIDNQQQIMMVPTNDDAMESMLKRVENEEIKKLGDDESINCVICLEEIGKEEKGSERMVLQMPCLHIFHGECIRKWLKTSHYCPTCRFSMPIDN